MNWIALTNINQIKEIKDSLDNTFSAIFKHSTRCGISRMVLKNFENEFDIPASEVTMYYLDLLNFRDLSNAIATDFNVMHQSPQLVLIKSGKVIYNASHGDISVDSLKNQLSK
ncbi:bacillithiol system redox-active protein YtxJ [Lutibacter sp.]|uniref:bacillithiol system redox-active protein YtxJ n=1 Tax=Lutibacter sp. TaxID=1925666 RepID=UPI00356ACF75